MNDIFAKDPPKAWKRPPDIHPAMIRFWDDDGKCYAFPAQMMGHAIYDPGDETISLQCSKGILQIEGRRTLSLLEDLCAHRATDIRKQEADGIDSVKLVQPEPKTKD